MPFAFPESFPAFHFEHDQLRAAEMLQNLSFRLGSFKLRRAEPHIRTLAHCEDILKFDLPSGFTGKSFDCNDITRLHFELFSANGDYCIHLVAP